MSVTHVTSKRSSIRSRLPAAALALALAVLVGACVPEPQPTPEEAVTNYVAEQTKGAIDGSKVKEEKKQQTLPVRYQRPSYTLTLPEASMAAGVDQEITVPVGAKITTPDGPKPLRTVVRKLAELKNMNVSWASDVDQDALVDVTIMPDEDFFTALGQLLRQLDYFYEIEGNTIVVQYKATRKFHIAMPFVSSTYSTAMGGDVLGSSGESNMSGNLQLKSDNNPFDVWKNIQENLNRILEIWSAPAPSAGSTAATQAAGQGNGTTGNTTTTAASSASAASAPPTGKGYYTIDRPIGLITVTAPQSLLTKVEAYINGLKSELYRQVSIEAKIVEVTLSSDNTTGLDWSGLLNDAAGLGMKIDFGSKVRPVGQTPEHFLTIEAKSFNLLLDAMKNQGHVEVLSNPKISVMNGQPAMISVGENVKYVDNVQSTTDEGVVSYTINTASVMSGLGLGVVATIMDNNEIILSLTPVTSSLQEPIEYKVFGDNQVGLPKVKLREMQTMVKVRDGEMLVVGGLIANRSSYNNDYVAGLGKLPVAGKLFRTDGTAVEKKELIILLRPQVINFD